MVAGTALGLGNKILKQDRLGLCLQTGTDQEGKKTKKKKKEQRGPAKNMTRHLRAYIVSLI